MSRDIFLDVKAEEFSGFLKSLERKLAGAATIQKVTDSEVSKILERAIAITGKANELKLRSKVGGLRIITIDGKRQPLYNNKTGRPQRFPNGTWSLINTVRHEYLMRLLAARGLAAQSWYLLAHKLGYDVKAPDFVKQAIPSRNRKIHLRNVSVSRGKTGAGNYTLTIENNMPIIDVPAVNGRRAIFAAIAGRANYFIQNLYHGVFSDASEVAKKYKGIIVTKGF